MRDLSGLGMQMLPNRAILTPRGARLVLAGVTDVSAKSVGQPGPDLGAALAGAPLGEPVIWLDHRPKNARREARQGVAVQLSGYTHGGMIAAWTGRWCVPMPDSSPTVTLSGDMTIYVSNERGCGRALQYGRTAARDDSHYSAGASLSGRNCGWTGRAPVSGLEPLNQVRR